MVLVKDKKVIIFGIANDKSIAYGIAKKLRSEGAIIGLTYAGAALEKRVMPIAEELDAAFCVKCDVTNDEDLDKTFDKAADKLGNLDILVHSVAFAPQDDLKSRVVDVSRAGFQLSLDISAYSLIAMMKRAEKLMVNGGSVIAMTYYGAQKVVINYNIMGVVKATLEAIVKYLAGELGQNKIRVNAISAGPIRTLASSGISGFKNLSSNFLEKAPLKCNITQEDVADAALFLSSDLSSKITGEILFVDGGYNILGF